MLGELTYAVPSLECAGLPSLGCACSCLGVVSLPAGIPGSLSLLTYGTFPEALTQPWLQWKKDSD